METRIHPTAEIEEGVTIGGGTAIWNHVHVRQGAAIGAECIVGEKSHIAGEVRIGDRVKINSFVYICAGVTLEDGVMVSAGTLFTNDRAPRATTPDLSRLRSSASGASTRSTLVRAGATLGAGSVIGSGIEIGRWAMVGMGSVVTRSVPDFHLVVGNPARSVGVVCRCGDVLLRFAGEPEKGERTVRCAVCRVDFRISGSEVREAGSPS